MENITLQYPSWFLIFCIIAGVLYAGVLYYKERKFEERPSFVKPTLSILRFLSVSILSFLLLSPVIKSQQQDIKNPIIIIAEDASESIQSAMSAEKLDLYSSKLTGLTDKLKEAYEVVNLSFGENVINAKRDSFTSQSTNLSRLFSFVDENYADQNVGAIILASDGIYNEGQNPLYQSNNIKSPVFSIGLGDTTIKKDLFVSNVLHNKLAYLGDKSSIKADIQALNAKGASTTVSLYSYANNKRQLLEKNQVYFENNNDFKTFDFTFSHNTVGINKYQVVVNAINNEGTTVNNARTFYVEVLDGRQKILLLADGPHPDLSAIKSLLESNVNYEVTTKMKSTEEYKISDYDLVIFHNLPSVEHDIANEIEILNRARIPRLFVAGTTVSVPKFNQVQDVVEIIGNSNNTELVQGSLVAGFNEFTVSELLTTQIKQYPPLNALFGEIKPNLTSKTLLFQNIKKIKTPYPLLSFNTNNGIKEAVITAEGIWRWKIYDFQELNMYDPSKELISKTIQYLTAKDDKRKFRVNLAQNVYNETEDINIDAQLYNDSYEMINSPDVNLSIQDDKGNDYSFTFSKSNNYYTLNAGRFPEGEYRYAATVNYNGQPLQASGRFTVKKIELEQYSLTANHSLMNSISQQYNGGFYDVNDMDKLSDKILNEKSIKPVIYTSSISQSILNNKWIFFLIVGLLFLEWFMRRYYGSY